MPSEPGRCLVHFLPISENARDRAHQAEVGRTRGSGAGGGPVGVELLQDLRGGRGLEHERADLAVLASATVCEKFSEPTNATPSAMISLAWR